MLELIITNSPIIATIFFFSFFCLIIFLVFKKDSKQKFNKYAQIPFLDGEPVIKNIVKKNNKKNFKSFFNLKFNKNKI
jgi:cbb3-type cytochrome oxidase subunit 3